MDNLLHYETVSDRMYFRRLRADDFPRVAPILQDAQVAGHAFSFDEVCDRIVDVMCGYREGRCACLAAVDRQSEEFAALVNFLPEAGEENVSVAISCLVRRDLWGHGYGGECAEACTKYAFEQLGAARVTAAIPANQIAALHIAARCGMLPVNKPEEGADIPVILCAAERSKNSN